MPDDDGSILLSPIEQKKWEDHRLKLADRELAPTFRGWQPSGYSAAAKRILYVGKATSGTFDGPEAERKYFFNAKGAFWNFGRQIAKALDCESENIPCIAWSNISKFSMTTIKAARSLIKGFEDEASFTLETEIEATKPHVIVFVTSHFSDFVVRKIAEGKDDATWDKSESELAAPADIWWKRRKDGRAVLWMPHPMRAKKEVRAFAARKIASLCPSGS